MRNAHSARLYRFAPTWRFLFRTFGWIFRIYFLNFKFFERFNWSYWEDFILGQNRFENVFKKFFFIWSRFNSNWRNHWRVIYILRFISHFFNKFLSWIINYNQIFQSNFSFFPFFNLHYIFQRRVLCLHLLLFLLFLYLFHAFISLHFFDLNFKIIFRKRLISRMLFLFDKRIHFDFLDLSF